MVAFMPHPEPLAQGVKQTARANKQTPSTQTARATVERLANKQTNGRVKPNNAQATMEHLANKQTNGRVKPK